MTTIPPSPGGLTNHKAHEIRRLIAERMLRQVEGLSLYEALPTQAAFHRSECPQRLARGSNRSGKTLCSAVEVARAVTGQDPWRKYPQQDGRWYCVGKNLDHVGQVMARYLLKAGAFRILKDPLTDKWRAYRPWDPADQPLKHLTKPSPPLIPKRLIKAIAWEGKAKGIPRLVTLRNGWELSFYSSEGKPPQGSKLEGCWMDEEIIDEDWYPEMRTRLVDNQGRMIWSATPQAGTDKLFELHERALAEAGESSRAVEEFVLLLADNPHIAEADKKALEADLSEDQRQVRILGEFALHGRRVFPEWNLPTHGHPWRIIPLHWTRYAFIDPGRQIAAVLFCAVPPRTGEEDGCGDFYYLYDELYLPRCSAAILAEKMREKLTSQTIEAFIIDRHGSRQTEAGSGLTIETQYTLAFQKKGVRSVRTGTGFLAGGEDVMGGVEAMRELLRIREEQSPKLRVLCHPRDPTKCLLPSFEYEIKRYRYKIIKGILQDQPEDGGRVHLMACFRYLALYRPRHVAAGERRRAASGALAALRAKEARARQKDGDKPMITLGPSGGKR